MRIQDQKLTFSQLPRIVDADNTVGVLSTAVHNRTAYFLKMIADDFALLDDLFPVADVQDSAIEVSEMLDHPRDLSCAYPLPRVSEFVLASKVDSVN